MESKIETESGSLIPETVEELPSIDDDDEAQPPQDDEPKGGLQAWLYVLAAFLIFINAW